MKDPREHYDDCMEHKDKALGRLPDCICDMLTAKTHYWKEEVRRMKLPILQRLFLGAFKPNTIMRQYWKLKGC